MHTLGRFVSPVRLGWCYEAKWLLNCISSMRQMAARHFTDRSLSPPIGQDRIRKASLILQESEQALTETIRPRAGVLLQPGQSRLKVFPGFLTESTQCWKQKSEIDVCVWVTYLYHKTILRLQGPEASIGLLLPLLIPIIQIPAAGTTLTCSWSKKLEEFIASHTTQTISANF